MVILSYATQQYNKRKKSNDTDGKGKFLYSWFQSSKTCFHFSIYNKLSHAIY